MVFLMLMILALLVAGAFIIGGWRARYKWQLNHKDEDYWHQGFNRIAAGYVIAVIAVLILAPVSIAVPMTNITTIAKLEALYNANEALYDVSYTEAAMLISEQQPIEVAMVPVEGSVEKIDVGKRAIDLLTEWRDNVCWYNTHLTTMRTWDTNIFIGLFVPTPPDYLKYITVTR